MSLFNKYDSSRANTDITITTTANTSIRTYTRTTSSSTTYACQTYTLTGSTLYSIAGSYFGSGTSVLLKMTAPQNPYSSATAKYGIAFMRTGSGVSYLASLKPTYTWRKGDYIYAQFDNLNLSAPLYPVYFYNSSSSSGYNYSNYLPVQIISATSFASWQQTSLKIYDDGAAQDIKPSIYYMDSFQNSTSQSNSGGYVSSSRWQNRIWEVTAGNTYTLRTTTARGSLYMATGNLDVPLKQAQGSYTETAYTVPTPTTDPDTGEYIYTITIPSGKTSLRVAADTNSLFVDYKLNGQRTPGWYSIDDYYVNSNNKWIDTENLTLHRS